MLQQVKTDDIRHARIAIIDYGMGNLRSVQKAFEKVGHQAVVTSDPAQVAAAAKVVLPGVGRLRGRHGRAAPARSGQAGAGRHRLRQAVPGHLPGAATAVRRELRERPARGARRAAAARSCGSTCPRATRCRTWAGTNWPSAGRPPLLEGLAEGTYVYFVHSYYVVPKDAQVIATETDYGGAVLLDDLARQRLRHPVPPREEPGRRPADAEETSRSWTCNSGCSAALAFSCPKCDNWAVFAVLGSGRYLYGWKYRSPLGGVDGRRSGRTIWGSSPGSGPHQAGARLSDRARRDRNPRPREPAVRVAGRFALGEDDGELRVVSWQCC